MSSIPLPALHAATYQAPDVMDQYSKILQIKQLLGQGQMQQQALQGAQLENQQRQQELKDSQIIADAYRKWDPQQDPDGQTLARDFVNSGGSGKAAMALQQQILARRKEYADIAAKQASAGKDVLKNIADQNDMVAGRISQILAQPDEALPQSLVQTAQQLSQTRGWDGNPLLDQQHLQMAAQIAQSGDPKAIRTQLEILKKGYMGENAQIDAAAKSAQSQKIQAELPGVQAESQIKQQDASLSPMERSLKNQNALEYYAAKGDPMAQAALQKKIEVAKASRPVINNTTGGDIKDVAQAIYDGQASPILTDYSFRDRTAIAAELKRLGYDSVKASMDYKAVQKQIQTLNGPQQTRLRQSITSANDMIDKVETLYNEWKQVGSSSGMKMFNRASLAAAKQMPGRPGAVAQALDAQISDLVADLGNIYMGGNSPTDHALSLAAKSFQSDWNDDTMREALKQARANVKIRANSIANTQPAGVSEDSPYLNKSGKQPNQQPKNDPLGVL